MIKIISGKFKNNLLKLPKIYYNSNRIKATPSFIRKKIFNWLGDNIKNSVCLDAFSGSGSLALEAVSRGCKLAFVFEKNKKIFFYLKKNFNNLKINNVKIFNCSFINYIKIKNFNFLYDIVFLDSPYILLNKLFKYLRIILKFLKRGAYIYIETMFEINILIKTFKGKITVLKNDFFKKINLFLLKVL